MRSTWMVILVVGLVLAGCGTRQAKAPVALAPVESVAHAGAPITMSAITPLKALQASPAQYEGQTIAVEGRVTGRCMGSGCWVSLDTGNPEEPFYAKSIDHSFAFPEECMGQLVRIQGVFIALEPPADAEGSHEEEHDEHEGDEGHVCPEPIYLLNPTGVTIAP